MGITFDDALRVRATRAPNPHITEPQNTATMQTPIATPNHTPMLRGSCVAAAAAGTAAGDGLALALAGSVTEIESDPGGIVAFARGTVIPAAAAAGEAINSCSSSPTVTRIKKSVTLLNTAICVLRVSDASGTTTARATT